VNFEEAVNLRADGLSLRQVGLRLGCSGERVRQILERGRSAGKVGRPSKYPGGKRHSYTFRVRNGLWERLRQEASLREASISETIEDSLIEYFEAREFLVQLLARFDRE
jgi:transposase